VTAEDTADMIANRWRSERQAYEKETPEDAVRHVRAAAFAVLHERERSIVWPESTTRRRFWEWLREQFNYRPTGRRRAA
jgi:hypothetical protein